MGKHLDYKAIYEDYVKCELSLDDIYKKHGVNKSVIELLVKNYAENEIGDLSEFNLALVKRKKLKKKKQKEAQEEHKRKIIDEKEEAKLEEAKSTMNDFLNSEMDEIDFCVQEFMSVKYFEDLLCRVKSVDKKLYDTVIDKFRSDDIKQKQQRYNDKSNSEENKKIGQANDFMKSFLKYSKTKKEFCLDNKISKKYFDTLLAMTKESKPNLYHLIKEKMSSDLIHSSVILKKIISTMSKSINRGISNNDGTIRKFTLLDYYKRTNIPIKNLISYSNEFQMSNEYEILADFEKENSTNLSKITLIQMVNKEDDDEDKVNKVFKYIEDNNLPLILGVYDQVKDKLFVQNDISKINNDLKMDDLLSQELNANEPNNKDIAQNAINIIKSDDIERQKILVNE